MTNTEQPNPEMIAKENEEYARQFYSIRAKFYDLFNVRGDIDCRLESLIFDKLQRLKDLEARLDEWKYELAYYTKEDVATPKGVKEFIGGFFDRLDVGKIEPVVYKLLCSMPTKFNINTIVRSFSKAIIAFVTKGETPKVKL